MKIVSDFDGVLTDIASEADRVDEWFTRYLTEIALIPPPEVTRLRKVFEDQMKEDPFRFGWKWNGRISAFCNEDGFIKVNALAAAFDEAVLAGEKALVLGKQYLPIAGLTHYLDVAQKAYRQTTDETARGSHQPMEKQAVQALGFFHREGAQVVVVSNSETPRIRQLLQAEGLPVDSPRLVIRGGAGKFKLGDRSRPFALTAPPIDTDRPLYEKILLEERPDHVFGDVFSLDLALPLYLRRQSADGLKGVKVWLRERPYSPHWALKLFRGDQPAIAANEGGSFDGFDSLITSRRLS